MISFHLTSELQYCLLVFSISCNLVFKCCNSSIFAIAVELIWGMVVISEIPFVDSSVTT
ncbi:hypothetical protein BDK88_0091 [Natrinema hispanicum]|uniref:Uncharacterized protein n=1 Tax=Natrinema hispanicum TaxID=392421 RepID=A0A482YKV3_9EURY|nr:hypothetical protein BDK88_0091 [Natrinema hispanicum]